MRFLCFHGIGTNSETFKQQTAAIRYELGDIHSYEFVDGTLAWEMDENLKQFMIPGEQTFAYCTPTIPETCIKAGNDLDRYLEMEGPYDGVIAFSSGATFVLSWMINKIREKNPSKPLELPFKVGIFFSNVGRLAEFHHSAQPSVTTLDETETNGVIDMPTAHIWGIDDLDQENARLASQACNETTRSVYVHGKGHEVPMSTESVISAVKAINRAIARAQGSI